MRVRHRRGMTLIETLVMLGLTGIFGGIALPMIRTTTRGIRRNQDFAAQFVIGRQALDDVSAQIRQIAPLPGGAGAILVGEDGAEPNTIRDRLTMTGTSLAQLRAGALSTVDYYIEPDATGARVLWKRTRALDGRTHVRAVGRNIVGFDVAYLAAGEWHRAWSGPELPDAVRVVVHVIPFPGARSRTMFTEVNVPGRGA